MHLLGCRVLLQSIDDLVGVRVEMDTEEICQIAGWGYVRGTLSCISPRGPRTYLIIVLLCVLVELV